MDLLITDLMGARTYIDVTIVSPIVNTAYHLAAAAKKPGYAALRAEYGKRQRYPTPDIVPFVLELGGRPGPTALRFIRDLFKHEGATRTQSIADAWSTLSSTLHSSTAEQIHKTHPLAAPSHDTTLTPTAPEAPASQAAPTQLDTPSTPTA